MLMAASVTYQLSIRAAPKGAATLLPYYLTKCNDSQGDEQHEGMGIMLGAMYTSTWAYKKRLANLYVARPNLPASRQNSIWACAVTF
jgi:hypothetical protein